MWDLIVSVPDHCVSFYVRTTFYLRAIYECRKSKLKMLFNMKNFITITSAKTLKSDNLGQKCQQAHAVLFRPSK